MTPTALIKAPARGDLPPLLGVVPVAGPDVGIYVGFGLVLLLLLVPPFALLATLLAVALVVASALVALVALVVLAAVIIRAPFLLVRHVRGLELSLPVPHLRDVKVRRV